MVKESKAKSQFTKRDKYFEQIGKEDLVKESTFEKEGILSIPFEYMQTDANYLKWK